LIIFCREGQHDKAKDDKERASRYEDLGAIVVKDPPSNRSYDRDNENLERQDLGNVARRVVCKHVGLVEVLEDTHARYETIAGK
jgi:hypothetical protein